MTASTAEMATVETAVESTTGMREHRTVMKPGPSEAVGAERVAVKAVVIKVALMMEAVPPITPIGTAVVVSVARIPVGSVIAGALHTSSQANHRDKKYRQQNWFHFHRSDAPGHRVGDEAEVPVSGRRSDRRACIGMRSASS